MEGKDSSSFWRKIEMERIADGLAQSFEKAVYPIARFMNRIGVSLVLLIVGIITADIALRYLFNMPIPGSLEITELTLPLVVFLAVAYTAMEKRHVGIDILYLKLGEGARSVLDGLTSLLSIYVVAIMTWQIFSRSSLAFTSGESGDVIGVPYWPSMALMAVGCAVMVLVLFIDTLRAVAAMKRTTRMFPLWLMVILGGSVVLCMTPWLMDAVSIDLSGLGTGVFFIGFMLVLMFMKMPIAFCMAFIGFEGLWYLKGVEKTLPLMALGPWIVASHWSYSVIPTFVVMGMFAFHSRMSKDLYETGYKWFGHQPGGLALTTVAACGGFASICGCSTATAGTMGTIALPEMKRFNYKPSLSAGSVAAGGTLGILIPPSLGFMIYGIITEESIGKLFIAGIIPGIILVGLFMASIYLRCRIRPELGPGGPAFPFREKVFSLKNTWAMLTLFLGVMGGLYAGIFTPTEAGAIGAFGAFIIGLAMGRLSWSRINEALLEAGRLTAMIFMILCCVKILTYFIALTKIPFFLSELILSFGLSRYWVLFLVLLLYVILGMLMNIIPMMILTLPIIFPMVMQLGFDPIWFGVVMVIMMEMGQITPPVGINTFVVAGVAPDIPMGTIFKGIMPFWLIQFGILALLMLFPGIATFLPNLMG